MKGITPVIALILLLVIVIVVVGFSFGIFQGIISSAGESAQNQADTTADTVGMTVALENIYFSNTAGVGGDWLVSVRNQGSVALTAPQNAISVYIDGVRQTCMWTGTNADIAAGTSSTCTATLTACPTLPATSQIRVTSPSGATQSDSYTIAVGACS